MMRAVLYTLGFTALFTVNQHLFGLWVALAVAALIEAALLLVLWWTRPSRW